MKIKDIITESSGMFSRKPGDQFVHTDGREAEFQGAEAYPDPDQGQFESPEQRDEAIKQYEDSAHLKIEWSNRPTNGMLAFAIATLKDREGGLRVWGRYLQKSQHNMMGKWKNTEVPAGWSLAVKAAKKIQAGYDPQNLIKTPNVFMTTDKVINTVKQNAHNGVKEAFVQNLTKLAQGRRDVRFPGMADQMEAVRDYFGEIMHPLALEGGVILGQAEDARELLADGANWANCQMRWPMGMNEPLCDSFMIAPNGQEIGISSKGGAGAKASAKNLWSAYEDAVKAKNQDLIDTAKYTIQVAKVIVENTSVEGPVVLGKALNMPGVDDQLLAEIKDCIKSAKRDYEGLSQTAVNLLSNFKANNNLPGFNTGNAILSALAKLVALEINKNPEFSKGALALLNQASIIQVYTTMAKDGNDAVLKDFRAVYPPKFDGRVVIDAGKNYTSTRIIGKMAFSFK